MSAILRLQHISGLTQPLTSKDLKRARQNQKMTLYYDDDKEIRPFVALKKNKRSQTPREGAPVKRYGYWRPCSADMTLSADDVTALVSRLTRPTTATARKSVLWSPGRLKYETNFSNRTTFKSPQVYQKRYEKLTPPGTQWKVTTTELDEITARVSKETVSSTGLPCNQHEKQRERMRREEEAHARKEIARRGYTRGGSASPRSAQARERRCKSARY